MCQMLCEGLDLCHLIVTTPLLQKDHSYPHLNDKLRQVKQLNSQHVCGELWTQGQQLCSEPVLPCHQANQGSQVTEASLPAIQQLESQGKAQAPRFCLQGTSRITIVVVMGFFSRTGN